MFQERAFQLLYWNLACAKSISTSRALSGISAQPQDFEKKFLKRFLLKRRLPKRLILETLFVETLFPETP